MNAKSSDKRFPKRKKTGRAGNGVKSRLLRAEPLEERALLSVSPVGLVAPGGCDVQLDPWDDVCVASERNEALVVSFDCPGCSALASSAEDVEAYPAFGESIDEALIAAGQNLDAISKDFVFNLSSLPESTYTIYLDFDGNVVSGSSWNNGDTIVTPPYDVDGNEGSFSNVELRHIYEIWSRVSENYIPFNVNVTTKKPTTDQLMKSDAADDEYGMHVAVGGSCDDWYKSGAGGVAFVGSFTWDSDTPCFVFPKSLAGPRTVADAITHEVGHTLGLSHDGRIAHDDVEKEEYFGGSNGWGPHMGAAYSADITQWSKGEYEFASNVQDDLEIITTRNGFTYRDDDHGDELATATPLMFDVSGTLGSGIIERNTDVDFFSFTLSGEKTVISVGGVENVTSLDAFVNLYDASGEIVATYDPLDTFYVTIDTAELAPGKYYLGVSGTGRCVDGVLHYTDYSSLGAYTIVTNNEKSIDDYEPNNSFTKAVELGFLSGTSSYDSYVGASDGEDWYRFTIGATGTADNFVRVNYERDPDRHCLFFGLYDANQKQLDYQFTLSVSEETVSLANRPAGTYYVKIYNYFNLDEPFPYSLTVNAPSAQPPVVHEVGAVELSTIKPYVGTTLTATAFPADATVAWQWYRGTRSDFVKSPIVGANSNAYTPTADDVGYYLSVQAVGTGDYEGLSTASTVSPVLDKLVSATLSSDKPALGTALEATLSPAGADVVWQWYRGTKTDLFGTKIDGANEASYVPTVDDVGSYLTVVAIGSGFYEGTVTATASSPVEGRVVSVNLSSNSPKVGTKLTASASPSVASVSWQWYRGTHSDFFNTPIKGANANSYTPTAADDGYYISVKAFGTGDYGGEASATTASPVGGKPKDIYEPNNSASDAYDLGSLSGTTTIGSYVGASDGDDWYMFTTGATGDADSFIKVNYEYDYDAHCIFFGLYDSNLNEIDRQFYLGVSEEKISLNNRPAGTYFIRIYNYFDLNEPFPYSLTLATPKVDDPNAYKLASVELSTDEPSVGAAITTTLDPENAVVAWQWYRGTSDNLFKTAISGATESVYTPTTSDLGYYLSVKAIGKDGYQGTVSASTSEKVARRLVSVSLSSTEPTLGEKIKATVSPSGASVSWQWYRSTGSDSVAISGATKDEYVPTAADVGAYLFVVATGKGEYAGSVRATTDSTVARKVVSVSLPTTKPSVGATIAATVSPSDADVVWQWYRGTSSDAFETPIVGANKGEYTPTSDDSGYYLGVKAIGKGDYRGTATASTKSAVPFDDFSVALSSMKPSVGAPITATVDPESATVTWQWYRGTSSNLFQTAISGATKNSYTPTSADVGYYLSVKAIGKGDYEGTVAASTNAKVVRGLTSVALSTNEPEMGKELTATVSPSGADVVWRWYRGTSSEPFQTVISGATSSSYTPTQDDLGFYLSVEVVGKGDYDGTVCATSESAVVVKDLSVALSSTKPSVGASLTATLYPQGAEATWQWYRGTSSNAFQTAISGATKSSYTPTSADLGFYLGVKAVGKGDYQGTATAATSAKVVDKIVSVDLPTGKPYVGTTLTATVAPDNADVSWQWYRGTSSDAFQTAISGATDRSYTPTSDDLGLYLSVKASGKGDYEGTVSATTGETVGANIVSVALSATNPTIGTELTASVSPDGADVSWQWYRGTSSDAFQTAISGATKSSYTPTSADLGFYLSVKAVGKGDYEGNASTTTSASVVATIDSVELSSTNPMVGTALTASVSPDGADVSWQWYRGTSSNAFQTAISDATNGSYTPTSDDLGWYLSVKGVGKGDYEGTVSATTSATVVWTIASVAFSSSNPSLGTALTAIVSPSGADVSWQWYRGTSSNAFQTAISGATKSSYTPTSADLGFYLGVRAVGKGDYQGTVSASTSAKVVDEGLSVALSSTNPMVGTALTATVSPENADVTWQWYRGTSDNLFQTAISGANANAYEPTTADVGYYLSVKAVGQGNYQGTVSASTDYSVVDKVVSVKLSTENPSAGTQIAATVTPANADVTWQWYRSTPDRVFQTLITGADESVYVPTDEDVGYCLCVKAIGKGDYTGTVSATTGATVRGVVTSVALSTTKPQMGTTLTANVSPSDADVTWQWYRGTETDLFKTKIAGATTSSYTATSADGGYYLSVIAVGKGDYDGTVSASTETPVERRAINMVVLSATTQLQPGKSVAAKIDPRDADVTWQWYRGTSDNLFKTAISGANASYYTATDADVGYYLSVKAIGKGDYEGTAAASTNVKVGAKVASVKLSSESPAVGTPITATVAPTNADVTWQWCRGTSDNLFQTAISGANANVYTPTDADVGYFLSVRAVGKGDYTGTVTASTSASVLGKVDSVELSSTKPQIGTTLTATVAPETADVTWQWYRGTKKNLFMLKIADANESSYTTTSEDADYYISVRAFGQGNYDGVAQASTEEAVVRKTVVAVDLSYDELKMGAPVAATVAPENADVAWRWYRGTNDNLFQTEISGAETSSYTPTVADVGYWLSVKAVGKGDFDGEASASTNATITGVVGAIELSSTEPAVGTEITASIDPAESDVTWRWYRGTSSEPFKSPITGATSSAYTPTVADVGFYLSVRAVGKGDYEGTAEASATATVVDPLTSVELSSTQPRVGTSLTATVAPENADVTWRWYRGTSDDLFQTAISGADSNVYLPTIDDVGYYLSVKSFGVGDYAGEVSASTSAAVVLDWKIFVTIEEDEFDHGDDFDQDGAPDRISLREAYDYVNRYYNGAGDMNDFANWILVADDNVDPATGTSVDQNRAVYKTIRFQEPAGVRNEFEISLDAEIVSDKSFTIDGVALGGAQVSVSGAYFSRIFKITSGTIVADRLVLKNGYAIGNDDDADETSERGGALLVQSGGTYVANGGGFSSNVANKYGGAVYVAEGGTFVVDDYVATDGVDSVEFEYNEATRGGAIANYGTVTISGSTTFEGNSATPRSNNPTNGSFGGAIYNAGALTIGSASSDARTTFDGNVAGEATGGSPVVSADGVLKGYCGGAIYNTTGGSVEAYDVDCVNNFAGKYGGAISNFSSFVAVNSTFENNRASSGGAAQSSGTALFDSCSFAANVALRSCFALVAEDVDYGGNGGAVFTSRTDDGETSGGVAFTGATTFSENQAANAGGAIDVVSGALTFDGADVVVAGNVAGSIGGAIVFGGDVNFNESTFAFEENRAGALEVFDFDELFHQEPPQGEFGFYAPDVAAGCDASDQAIVDAKRNFFPNDEDPGADKFAALVRYETTVAGSITFDDLVGSFDVPPTAMLASVDGEDAREMSSGDSLSLSVGPHTILFADVDYPDVVFRANVYVVDATTSLILTQLDIGSGTFAASGKKYPVGVSIRIVSAGSEPVRKWTLNWGDGKKDSFDAFGYVCNAYHIYDKAKRYDLTLTTVDADGVSATYENLGYCVAKTPETSGAELDLDDFFADSDWLDELFND